MIHLLLLLLLTLLWAAPASADLTFFWRVEGTTLDGTHDFTAGTDTTASLTGATIDATAALVGSNGLNVVTGGSARATFSSEAAVVDRTVGSIGFHFNLQTFGTTQVFLVRGANSSNFIEMRQIGTDTATGRELRFTISDQGGATIDLNSTAFDLATSTHYFITASWDQPNSDRRIRLYTVSGGVCTLAQTVEDTTTSFTAPTELVQADTAFRFGSSATSSVWYTDNIFFGKAYNDEATFASNCGITSYTSYSAGGSSVNFFPRRLQVAK